MSSQINAETLIDELEQLARNLNFSPDLRGHIARKVAPLVAEVNESRKLLDRSLKPAEKANLSARTESIPAGPHILTGGVESKATVPADHGVHE